ncbi:exocyst complex component 3-like protein 4 isoform X1 [Anolis carolinensis]|uniref:exocyst complex component 3-like protein 4 isoform X1 n=1 Tax=Anolis carolinensis TaxID=28377 RepID=UPI002F2B3D91
MKSPVKSSDYIHVVICEAKMDENKIEKEVVDGKPELSSGPEFPAKHIQSENGFGLPPNSQPFNNQLTNESKPFTRTFEFILSFRKGSVTSVKENSTETKMDEKKKEAEGKTELLLESPSPAKSEDSSDHTKTSLPFHNEEENEPKTPSKDHNPIFNSRKNMLSSSKDESSKVEMDENKTEIMGNNGKTELPPKQELLVKSKQSENDNCLPTASPPLNNSNNSIQRRSTFMIFSSASVKTERAAVSTKKNNRFSFRYMTMKKGNNQAKKESNNIPKKDEELEGEEGVLEEPLSVLEILGIIQENQLLEALKNIRVLEIQLLSERDAKKYEDDSKEDIRRMKDVNLLYDSLSKKIQQIVEKTLDLPSVEMKKLIPEMVALIEEEEKIHSGVITIPVPLDPVKQLGLARNWRNLWETAVKDSVKMRIHKLPIPLKEDNPSWLSVYLGFLKTVIRDDLLNIKHYIQKFYPHDYHVCDTYLKVFHETVSLCLQSILEKEASCLELRQFHALLDWVINIYYSQDLLEHPDLQPEIKTEGLSSLLPPDILDKLKKDYINSFKWKIKDYLENIQRLETEKWNKEQPEAQKSPYESFLSYDIQQFIGEHVKEAGSICQKLEREVLEISVKEVTDFLPGFGRTFLEWQNFTDSPRFVSVMVAHINNFHDLRTDLQIRWNASCEEIEKTLAGLMLRYKKYFSNALRLKIKPMLKKILSRAWISQGGTYDSFITKILLIAEDFSKDLTNLKDPMQRDFLNEVHRCVVKEYITQILKPRCRMRRIKREEVSNIMHCEAATINNTMQELGSSADWLLPAIQCIANIIAEKKMQKIKDYLKDLSQNYPDMRKEHISAILALQGMGRNKRNSITDQMDGPPEELEIGSDKILFAEIELQNTACCF